MAELSGVRGPRDLRELRNLLSVVQIGIAAGLAWTASDGTIILYQLGDWAAPFGIVLVGDRLSTMMVRWILTPADSRGTRNRLRPSVSRSALPVRATTNNWSALWPSSTKVFLPLST